MFSGVLRLDWYPNACAGFLGTLYKYLAQRQIQRGFERQ